MNGTEYVMDGGIWWNDDKVSDCTDRTDIYLEESGPGNGASLGTPLTLTLRIVTGSGDYALSGVVPSEMKRIGEFLSKTAKEIMQREGIVT